MPPLVYVHHIPLFLLLAAFLITSVFIPATATASPPPPHARNHHHHHDLYANRLRLRGTGPSHSTNSAAASRSSSLTVLPSSSSSSGNGSAERNFTGPTYSYNHSAPASNTTSSSRPGHRCTLVDLMLLIGQRKNHTSSRLNCTLIPVFGGGGNSSSTSNSSKSSASASAAPSSTVAAKPAWQTYSCKDKVFMNTNGDYTAPQRWEAADALDAFNTLNNQWKARTQPSSALSYSQYMANNLAPGHIESFQCACLDSTQCGSCGQTYSCGDVVDKPASVFILNSFSNIRNWHSAIVTAIGTAQTDLTTRAHEFTTTFVQFDSDDSSFIAEAILSGLVDSISLGLGQVISKAWSVASKAVTAGVGNQAFSDAVAEQGKALSTAFVHASKNLVGTGAALHANIEDEFKAETEIGKVMSSMTNKWLDTLNTQVAGYFDGSPENITVLYNMISQGEWIDAAIAPPQDTMVDQMKQILTGNLIPFAWRQNSNAHPFIMVRPYTCNDKDAEKDDDDFFDQISDDDKSVTMISVNGVPNKCFYVLDANKNQFPVACRQTAKDYCGGGKKPKMFTSLPGGTHTPDTLGINGNNWYDVAIDVYAASAWGGYTANGNANGFVFAPDENDQMFPNDLSTAGLFSDLFPVCEDIKLVKNNIEWAGYEDKSFADSSKYFPCRTDRQFEDS